MKKKIVTRKCVATGAILPKSDLLRVIRNKEGIVSVDQTGRTPGRGAYVSKSLDAIAVAKKKHMFDRALKVKVPEAIYDELTQLVSEGGKKREKQLSTPEDQEA